jgi:hypothetical protein
LWVFECCVCLETADFLDAIDAIYVPFHMVRNS